MGRFFPRFLAIVVLLAAPATLLAQAPRAPAVPASGTYVTEGGWGTLKVEGGGKFRLDSLGGNGHTCEAEGVMRPSARGGATARVEGTQCELRFSARGDRVQVQQVAEDPCAGLCGARATIQGDYFRELAACRPEQVADARAKFLQAYQAKQVVPAAGLLQGLLDRCGRFLPWTVDTEVRNDLAITYHRLKKDPECMKTLQPLHRTFIEDPEKSGRVFPPAEADWGEMMVKVSRYNWKLCGGKLNP